MLSLLDRDPVGTNSYSLVHELNANLQYPDLLHVLPSGIQMLSSVDTLYLGMMSEKSQGKAMNLFPDASGGRNIEYRALQASLVALMMLISASLCIYIELEITSGILVNAIDVDPIRKENDSPQLLQNYYERISVNATDRNTMWRVKGKAAIDVVCNPLGKSGVTAWLAAAKSLEGQFNTLMSEEELEKEMERAASLKIPVVSSEEAGESTSQLPETSSPSSI
ncbi:hypothetical protein YC2023_097001 [Brassica napus]